jgi:N-ethylmaleimide reductase
MKICKIFEPLLIGKLHLKNRIAMAPMTRGRAGKERVPGDLMAEYYFQRAGAGLLPKFCNSVTNFHENVSIVSEIH